MRRFILVITWSFSATDFAQSIQMVFDMPISSIFMIWIFTSMMVNGPVVRDSSLLYHVNVFLSSVINMSERRSTLTCSPIVKASEVQMLLS